jgi:hypothetical protein
VKNTNSQPIDKIGRVSTASVEKHTGKNWRQWLDILEKAGALNWKFSETCSFLQKKYRLTIWWRQQVTMGFEIHHGRRIEGRSSKGGFSATSTKALPIKSDKLWDFLQSPEGLDIWLEPMAPFRFRKDQEFESASGYFGKVRTLKPKSRVRLSWQDTEWPRPSIVQIYLLARPKGRSMLAFMHSDLPDGRARMQMGARWREVLARIQQHLTL